MAKRQKKIDEKETLDYWLVGNTRFKELATSLFTATREKTQDPIGLVAAYQNLHSELFKLRSKPGEALQAIHDRFERDNLNLEEKLYVLGPLSIYFETQRDNFGHYVNYPLDQELRSIRAMLKQETENLLKQLKEANKGKGKSMNDFSSKYKLSQKSGAKINLIRVLNALHDLHYFVKTDKSGIEQLPTKIEFMEYFGNSFGVDLSDYAGALSQSLKEQTLEVNFKVFEEMKAITQKQHYLSEQKKK